MNILIIDWRIQRAQSVAITLRAGGHDVNVYPQVTGNDCPANLDDRFIEWPTALRQAVAEIANDRNLIALHVGQDQTGAEVALQEIYQDKYVVCFSGAGIPKWCRSHCAVNNLHTYISDLSLWTPTAGKKLIDACELLGSGDWSQAKATLTGIDLGIEARLEQQIALLNAQSKE